MDLFEKTLFLEITDSTIDFLLFTVSMGVSFGDFSSSAGHIRAMGKTGGNQGQLSALNFQSRENLLTFINCASRNNYNFEKNFIRSTY